MGMLKDICQDIFSVKNKYVGDFKLDIRQKGKIIRFI